MVLFPNNVPTYCLLDLFKSLSAMYGSSNVQFGDAEGCVPMLCSDDIKHRMCFSYG